MEQFFICITNIIMLGIFAKLAMYFNHWWIMIFGYLAMQTYNALQVISVDENDKHNNDQDNDHE